MTRGTSSPLSIILLVTLFTLGPGSVFAQPSPILETEFETSEAIPGQSLAFRLTVLVPTWMPKPVAFPTFEVPNVRVRLPERSTFPTRRSVNGETWSGVVRTYYLTPLVPGAFTIPSRTLEVTYAEPGGVAPMTTRLETEPFTVFGVVPEGAENLRPFIAATELALEQQVSDKTTSLAPGDSVERTVIARIEGASPFSLPQLLPELSLPGVAAYTDQPLVEENEKADTLSGTRTERLTLMAQGGGSGLVPAVRLDWYNLESGEVETAAVPAIEYSIIAPPPPPPKPDYARLMRRALALVLTIVVLVAAGRRLRSPVSAWLARRRQTRMASEQWAYKQVRDSIRLRDYPAMLSGLERWLGRLDDRKTVDDSQLVSALGTLGNARYGKRPGRTDGDDWQRLYGAVKSLRNSAMAADRDQPVLPALNS